MKWVLVAATFCIGPLALSAQQQNSTKSSSLQPNLPTKVYAPKVSKKKSTSKVTYDAREEFYDRIDENIRRNKKSERAKLNPEYSNFQYFGHKKPPKKRPPEKMKYCKICGIRH